MSLQKLYADVFQKRTIKREQLFGQENEILSDRQKICASTDARTCIKLYKRLHESKHGGNYELVVVPLKVRPTPEEMECTPEVTSE